MNSILGGKRVRNAEALGELQKSVSVARRKEGKEGKEGGRDNCKELERSIETTCW